MKKRKEKDLYTNRMTKHDTKREKEKEKHQYIGTLKTTATRGE